MFTGNWIINSIWISFSVVLVFFILSFKCNAKNKINVLWMRRIDRKRIVNNKCGRKPKKHTHTTQNVLYSCHFWLWKTNILNVYDYSRREICTQEFFFSEACLPVCVPLCLCFFLFCVSFLVSFVPTFSHKFILNHKMCYCQCYCVRSQTLAHKIDGKWAFQFLNLWIV